MIDGREGKKKERKRGKRRRGRFKKNVRLSIKLVNNNVTLQKKS